jgi:hypothetical protein
MSFPGKWMDLHNFMLSKVRQAQKKSKGACFSHLWKLDLSVKCMCVCVYIYIYIYIYIYDHI